MKIVYSTATSSGGNIFSSYWEDGFLQLCSITFRVLFLQDFSPFMQFDMVETSHCLALFLLLFRGSVLASTNYKGYFDFDGGTFAYGNAVAFHGQMLNSTPVDSKEVVDDTECFRACVKDSRCRSTNLKFVEEQSGKFLCQLLDTDKFTSPEVFNGSSDFHHYSFTVSLTRSIDAEFFGIIDYFTSYINV